MKQIKRITAILIAVVMLFSLASCSLVDASQTDITYDTIKIGVILKEARDTKTGTTGICNATVDSLTGLKFGISEERFKFIENVDPTDADAVADACKSLVNFECNIIIAADPEYYDDTVKAAEAAPAVAFLVYGAEKGNGKNVFAYNADIAPVVYLEGIAAGLKAAELKMPDIGFILADKTGVSIANVFAMGAKSANPAAKVSTVPAGTDVAAAAKELITKGCAVLASDIQSEEIAKAALENNVFFCDFGTEAFNNEDYADAFLCAPLYDFTQYFIDTINAVVNYAVPEGSDKSAVELLIDEGKLADYAGSLATGAAYLSEISVANGAKGSGEAIRNAISSGKSAEASSFVSALSSSQPETVK